MPLHGLWARHKICSVACLHFCWSAASSRLAYRGASHGRCASRNEGLPPLSLGTLGAGQVIILAPGPDHMAHLRFPDMLLSSLRAEMAPPDLAPAVKSCLTGDSLGVPRKAPVPHEPALGVAALERVAWADTLPAAERAALGPVQAGAVVYSCFPDMLMPAALRPALLGRAQPDRLLCAAACQGAERAEVPVQGRVQLPKEGRQLLLQGAAPGGRGAALLGTRRAARPALLGPRLDLRHPGAMLAALPCGAPLALAAQRCSVQGRVGLEVPLPHQVWPPRCQGLAQAHPQAAAHACNLSA